MFTFFEVWEMFFTSHFPSTNLFKIIKKEKVNNWMFLNFTNVSESLRNEKSIMKSQWSAGSYGSSLLYFWKVELTIQYI